MKKKFSMLMLIIMSIFVLPVSAFAAEKDPNPIDIIKGMLTFDFSVLEGMDFFFTPIGMVLSLLVVGALVFLLVRIFIKVVKIAMGKASLKDKGFWIEILALLIIIFFVISGAFFDMLSALYDWTSNQDLVEPSTETNTKK